jgi:hypothetical protein
MHELAPGDPELIGPYRLRGRLGAGARGSVRTADHADSRVGQHARLRDLIRAERLVPARSSRAADAARDRAGLHTAEHPARDHDPAAEFQCAAESDDLAEPVHVAVNVRLFPGVGDSHPRGGSAGRLLGAVGYMTCRRRLGGQAKRTLVTLATPAAKRTGWMPRSCRSMSMTLSVNRSWAGSAQPLASLPVPVRCRHAPVTSVTRPDAPSRPFLLHGCRDHAAPATWLGHPCS